jgi:hypothetical protein
VCVIEKRLRGDEIVMIERLRGEEVRERWKERTK